jgi:hypothetical protein
MSDKIKPHHLERKAILYVRQSSTYQVQNNLESQKLQYAMTFPHIFDRRGPRAVGRWRTCFRVVGAGLSREVFGHSNPRSSRLVRWPAA